jgi:carbamoyltransferase
MYPFMLATANVRQTAKCLLPAVTHVDGTARLQIVPDSRQDRFTALLRAYEQLTGVGVLLNTSFNIAGEPLVCSPADAVDTFMRSGLDALVVRDTLVRRRTVGTC